MLLKSQSVQTSVWDQNRYFYLSQDGDYLLQSRGVQRLMSPDSRSGVVVRDGDVKIVEGGVEKPVSPIIGGGSVDINGYITGKVGNLTFGPPNLNGAVIRIDHNYNSNKYIVMLIIDASDPIHQDNTVTVISKTSTYFQVKGKNNATGEDERTPFHFTMIRIE